MKNSYVMFVLSFSSFVCYSNIFPETIHPIPPTILRAKVQGFRAEYVQSLTENFWKTVRSKLGGDEVFIQQHKSAFELALNEIISRGFKSNLAYVSVLQSFIKDLSSELHTLSAVEEVKEKSLTESVESFRNQFIENMRNGFTKTLSGFTTAQQREQNSESHQQVLCEAIAKVDSFLDYQCGLALSLTEPGQAQ